MKKVMIPLLKEKGFKVVRKNKRECSFQHTEYPAAVIWYDFNPVLNLFETDIEGGKYEKTADLYLCMFLDGIDNFLSIPRTVFWHYDNDTELLGVYEKQYELLDNWVIDWMICQKYEEFNAYELGNQYTKNRIAENEMGISIMPELKAWAQVRFLPVKWKLEDFLD